MAIYACTNKNCKFIFERRGSVEACPDCGDSKIRQANGNETAEYKKNKAEIKAK